MRNGTHWHVGSDMRIGVLVLAGLLWASNGWVGAADWLHWRGPEQNGVARDTGMPSRWSLDGENLIWKQPYGGRSAPVVSRGRVYIINDAGEGITEQERVMCFDARTGEKLWEYRFNIFHTDIVTNRVGWANLAADAETGYIYAHGVQGLFFCFDPDGKVVWSRSLTEEFGRITGYGGRIGTPIVDEDLVIINMINASWGDQARGGHRFLAMNKRTGEIVWWSEPGGRPTFTIYSVPIVTVVNGQRLLICGGADGALHAIKARTGEKVWSYPISKRGINASPVVSGNYVFISHSEENLDSRRMGGVYCLDMSQVTNGRPKLVWRRLGILAGDPSPIVHDGRLYVADKRAMLYCFDTSNGRMLWRHKYGTSAKASPVWADGKIYVGDVASRFVILQPGDRECRTLHRLRFPPGPDGSVMEINASAAVSDGRLYVVTGDAIYCIGTPNGKPPSVVPPWPESVPAKPTDKPAHLQIVPADVTLSPGESVRFKARTFNANGELIGEVQATWSLPTPPRSPRAPLSVPAPKPLQGTIRPDGTLQVAKDVVGQSGYVQATAHGLTARARVRVAPVLPMNYDFESGLPDGWANLGPGAKFVVVDLDGNKVLKKTANNPRLRRAIVYMGMPQLKDYTIEADIRGSLGKPNFYPEMGVINCRYSLVIDGNKKRLLLRSWEANHRLEVRQPFPFEPDVWYRFKLRVTVEGDKGICKGKVWRKGEPEPKEWTITAEDPIPNREGSPAIYAYAFGITPGSPGAETFFDNVKVTPNRK